MHMCKVMPGSACAGDCNHLQVLSLAFTWSCEHAWKVVSYMPAALLSTAEIYCHPHNICRKGRSRFLIIEGVHMSCNGIGKCAASAGVTLGRCPKPGKQPNANCNLPVSMQNTLYVDGLIVGVPVHADIPRSSVVCGDQIVDWAARQFV